MSTTGLSTHNTNTDDTGRTTGFGNTFTGTGTGSDQQRLTAVLHGFRLLRVQVAHEFLCAACDDFRLVVHCCLPLNRDIHVYHMHGSAQDNVHLRVSISFTDIQQWEVQCRNLRSESKARER